MEMDVVEVGGRRRRAGLGPEPGLRREKETQGETDDDGDSATSVHGDTPRQKFISMLA
jgi:hypothetical protein